MSSSIQTVLPAVAWSTPHLVARASTSTSPNPDSSSSAGRVMLWGVRVSVGHLDPQPSCGVAYSQLQFAATPGMLDCVADEFGGQQDGGVF